jgi:hypothetical protein
MMPNLAALAISLMRGQSTDKRVTLAQAILDHELRPLLPAALRRIDHDAVVVLSLLPIEIEDKKTHKKRKVPAQLELVMTRHIEHDSIAMLHQMHTTTRRALQKSKPKVVKIVLTKTLQAVLTAMRACIAVIERPDDDRMVDHLVVAIAACVAATATAKRPSAGGNARATATQKRVLDVAAQLRPTMPQRERAAAIARRAHVDVKTARKYDPGR